MGYAILAGVIFLFFLIFSSKSKYYKKIFSEDHYREIAQWVKSCLDKHPVEYPSEEDRTSLLTSAQLGLVYTSNEEDGKRVVHFSISQATGHTTQAVGAKVIQLYLSLLKPSNCEVEFYQTESTVHHAVFTLPLESAWTTAEVESVLDILKNEKLIKVPRTQLLQ